MKIIIYILLAIIIINLIGAVFAYLGYRHAKEKRELENET